MIAAVEPREFVPFGATYIKAHPSLTRPKNEHNVSEMEDCADMLRALRGVSLQHSNKDGTWKLRQNEDGCEEELFTFQNVIVWSKRSKNGARQLLKTLTLEGKVQTALWCSFHLNDYKSRIRIRLEDRETVPKLIPVVVAIDSTSGFLHSFGLDGHDYLTNLPFLVCNLWSTAFGLLLERDVPLTGASASSRQLAVLFSLLHPLDEIAPVLTKTQITGSLLPKLCHFTPSDDVSVVFVSSNPSIVVTYHGNEGIHSIWRLRRTTLEEVQMASGTVNEPTVAGMGESFFASNRTPDSSIVAPSQSTPVTYPLRNRLSAATPSLLHQTSINNKRLLPYDSNKSSLSSSRLYSLQSPTSANPSWSNRLDTTMQESTMIHTEPLTPDVCLDHLWSEVRGQSFGEKAKKAFLTEDVVGQKYVCYVLPNQKVVKIVRYSENGAGGRMTFHNVVSVEAVDAESISSLKLMITIDTGRNAGLSLYTGTTRMCKVHVPSMPLFKTAHFKYPKRSSLASGGTPMTDPRPIGDDAFLSPTGPPPSDTKMLDYSGSDLVFGTPFKSPHVESAKFCDAFGDSVTLELVSDQRFRFTLPPFASCPLLVKSLQVLRAMLPREVVQSLEAKWYIARNAPGPVQMCARNELCAFFDFLLRLIGFESSLVSAATTTTPVAQKKHKGDDNGTDDDWLRVLSYERNSCGPSELVRSCRYSPKNVDSTFEQHSASILQALHLVYEDSKISKNNWYLLPTFAGFLYRLSAHMGLDAYQRHYRHDFPSYVGCIQLEEAVGDSPGVRPRRLSGLGDEPLDIFGWINDAFRLGRVSSKVPVIDEVTLQLKHVVFIVLCLLRKLDSGAEVLTSAVDNTGVNLNVLKDLLDLNRLKRLEEQLVLLLVRLNITPDVLSNFPCAVQTFVQDRLLQCKEFPNPEWSTEAFKLVGRDDLQMSSQVIADEAYSSDISSTGKGGPHKNIDRNLVNLLFPKDERVKDVIRMLRSDKPVPITVQQRPEVSDHDFIEEQERHLYAICIRTMALPVGRGMLTLNTSRPLIMEPLQIPTLCLTGRVPPKNITVDLTHIDVPQNMNLWPLFHNGVAAGLSVAPNVKEIDNTWILYNRMRSVTTNSKIEHSGFLLGLGLNGHLSKLHTVTIHDYLLRNDELARVGLLLGLAVSKRGTMDLAMTKILSIHVDALLPPTSTELDVASEVRIAAVLGVGLVYQGSGHKHMAEVLLGEIGRPPGPEMENCVDRESYALAAGLALGHVMLGKGSHMIDLSDLKTADTLHHLMVGGYAKPSRFMKEHRSPSYQIREGDAINVDVTSAGATLALGLMFFDTGNVSVAEWMKAPDTQYLLDSVRPDFLMLRTLARGLVLWSSVLPSVDWVESHLTPVIKDNAFRRSLTTTDIDCETMSQAYCNILAGACFCLGLRFAGTANSDAYDTLMHYTKMFLSMVGPSAVDQAGKNTLETCLMVCLLSASLVMAGTGDLEILRLCRHFRHRVGQSSAHIFYGSHMAAHMAMGFLFLGGGKLTLSTSSSSVAALVCALFPKFPTHSNDNRYHLQAFRHLYAMACEPRLLIPRDFVSKNLVYAHVEITLKDTAHYQGVKYSLRAPCFVPELHLVERVEIKDPRYWPIVFDCQKNWNVLRSVFVNSTSLFVKQKTACLPYDVDPKGYRTMFAQCALKNAQLDWLPKSMEKFSDSRLVIEFTDKFLKPMTCSNTQRQRLICQILLSCATKETIENIDVLLDLHSVPKADFMFSTLPLHQARIVFSYMDFAKRSLDQSPDTAFVPKELLYTVEQELSKKLTERRVSSDLVRYVQSQSYSDAVIPFVVYHDVSRSAHDLDAGVLGVLSESGMCDESIVEVFSALLT